MINTTFDGRFKSVEEDMTSAITLLAPLAANNIDKDLRRVFIDPERGQAIAGIRRETAHFGVALALATYGKENEIKLPDTMYIKEPVAYDYVNNEIIEGNIGLKGKEIETDDGLQFENVTISEAERHIDNTKMNVEGHFELTFSPNQMRKIALPIVKSGKVENSKINLAFLTKGRIPKGYMLGIGVHDRFLNETFIRFEINGKEIEVPVDSSISKVKASFVKNDLPYLFKPVVKTINEKKQRVAQVEQAYIDGVSYAIQHFDLGILYPSEPGYSVGNEGVLGVETAGRLDFKGGQNIRNLESAPNMVFDLDTFNAVMTTISNYPEATMYFNNNDDPVYIFAPSPTEYLPSIELILSPTDKNIRGRVCLR